MFWEYRHEILTVVAVASVMVASPGQDFAVITRNSLLYSRRAGVLGAFGIGAAIWLHVSYSLAGIALVIAQSPLLYNIIKYAGACYLLYLGCRSLFFASALNTAGGEKRGAVISDAGAFGAGFASNALNPKTTLFFLSIFTQVVNAETPFAVQILFGGIICLAHIIWFAVLALFLSAPALTARIARAKPWIERTLGVFLCGFALRLAAK
ncbi:MAG: LysE family transporter [Gammaproteobacteria bacterium]